MALSLLMPYADCAKCSVDVARRRCAIGSISNARWIVCKSVSRPNLLSHIRCGDTQKRRYSDTWIARYPETRMHMGVFMSRCRFVCTSRGPSDCDCVKWFSFLQTGFTSIGATATATATIRRSGFDSPGPWTITCSSSHQKASPVPYKQTGSI